MGGDGRGWDEVVCLCESLHHTLEPESSFFLRTPFFVCEELLCTEAFVSAVCF